MSYRINLILEEEQRSGSKLNAKSLVRISSIVLPALLIVLIVQQALSFFVLSGKLDILESRWSAIEPRQKEAARLAGRLNANTRTHSELTAWKDAKPMVYQQVFAVMETSSPALQLTSLRLDATLPDASAPPSPPKRQFTMSINGRTRHVNAMQVIEQFKDQLGKHRYVASLLESIDVSNFAADLDSDDGASRIFTVDYQLKTMPLEGSR